MKYVLVMGICLLLLGSIVTTDAYPISEKGAAFAGYVTRYVGGSGPGNYSTIQDAINASSIGDTVYVFPGVYHEKVKINVMSLKVIGAGSDSTTIDANPASTAVTIVESYTTIKGFTIKAYVNFIDGTGIYVIDGMQGIRISQNNLVPPRGIFIDGVNAYGLIENNTFYSNFYGIEIDGGHWGHNTIRNNTFVHNTVGIELGDDYDDVSHNLFMNCSLYGIESPASSCSFSCNTFIGNKVGLFVKSSCDIISNSFERNTVGLQLEYASNVQVHSNNFIGNRNDASFITTSISAGNNWDYNYWGTAHYPLGIKLIHGKAETRIPKIIQLFPEYGTYYYWIRWVNMDTSPVSTPFPH